MNSLKTFSHSWILCSISVIYLDMADLSIHVNTPLLISHRLSKLCGREVWLKMDNCQPSGSYKIRGIGKLVSKCVADGCSTVVCASGGNAGKAAAYAARVRGVNSVIVIPKSSPDHMVNVIKEEGASVIVLGENWNEAELEAKRLVEEKNFAYVHPFHHPVIWSGISPLVSEILESCPVRPAALVLSVGGGGLLAGVLEGLEKYNATDIAVVAMETQGAHCFSAALEAGRPVSIGSITSIATTLGALTVTSHVFDLLPGKTVISKVLSDREAVEACLLFADDHRCLVEPSCGVSLAAGYFGHIRALLETGEIPGHGPVIFVVCGGNGVTLELLSKWKELFHL